MRVGEKLIVSIRRVRSDVNRLRSEAIINAVAVRESAIGSQAQAWPDRRADAKRMIQLAFPLLLLSIMAVRLLIDAQTDSLTADEPLYIESGLCALTSRVIDLDPTNPPIYKVIGAS